MNVFARLVALGSLAVLLLAAGCTSQSEGQRCTTSADCQSDLFCFTLSVTSGVCCSAVSSLAVCNPGVTTPDSGAVEPEASTEAGSDEAATETGNGATDDAAAEGGSD